MSVVPFKKRPIDWIIVGFFIINLGFITYIVDIEQLIIADPNNFTYPAWPPSKLVDLVHWWGHHYDPLLMARPPWWRATIWIDSLFFGPFYATAIYAFIKGKNWIRTFCFVWAGMMMSNVLIILFEELGGPHASPTPGMQLFANGPWLLFPLLVIARLARNNHPFTEE